MDSKSILSRIEKVISGRGSIMDNEAGQEITQGQACDECGNRFSQDQLVEISDHLICASCKPQVMQRVKEGGSVISTADFGGFWIRAGAKIIDHILISIINLLLVGGSAFAMASYGPWEEAMIMANFGLQIFGMFIWLGYNTFFLGKYAATPGKMICGLEVRTAEQQEISYMQALGRTAAEIISGIILYIGYIMAAFDDEKRTLHDRIASTRVIKS
jgi:uncharacterized RDD family membrane protein YckC